MGIRFDMFSVGLGINGKFMGFGFSGLNFVVSFIFSFMDDVFGICKSKFNYLDDSWRGFSIGGDNEFFDFVVGCCRLLCDGGCLVMGGKGLGIMKLCVKMFIFVV